MGPEEKSRAGIVREEPARRPRVTENARGSYAIHDTERVDHTRDGSLRSAKPLRTTEPAPQGRTGEPESWPPMPSVPPELQGAPATSKASAAAAPSTSGTLSPEHRAPAKVVGGAIWEAVPSVIDAQPAANDKASANRVIPPDMPASEAAARESRIELTYLGRASAGDPNDALGRFEQLVERGAWDELAEDLEGLKERSPVHTLLYVIARREMLGSGQQDLNLTREAICAVSQLLNVPETSPTALLLSKRLLRRNPWNRAQKPSKKLSVGLMIAGLSLGAGVGWLATRLFM